MPCIANIPGFIILKPPPPRSSGSILGSWEPRAGSHLAASLKNGRLFASHSGAEGQGGRVSQGHEEASAVYWWTRWLCPAQSPLIQSPRGSPRAATLIRGGPNRSPPPSPPAQSPQPRRHSRETGEAHSLSFHKNSTNRSTESSSPQRPHRNGGVGTAEFSRVICELSLL